MAAYCCGVAIGILVSLFENRLIKNRKVNSERYHYALSTASLSSAAGMSATADRQPPILFQDGRKAITPSPRKRAIQAEIHAAEFRPKRTLPVNFPELNFGRKQSSTPVIRLNLANPEPICHSPTTGIKPDSHEWENRLRFSTTEGQNRKPTSVICRYFLHAASD